jgi:hypothetical protein
MTTEAQTQANRANAQKSTGPRTPEGKAKVAQNALKHGLLAQQAVVVGEDTDDFDLLRDQLYAEWAPVGPTEARLVERIAGLFWRLQRAERFGTESFDVMCQQCADDPQIKRWRPRIVPAAASPVVGLTVVKDFSETRVLERLLVCERRLENSLYRTMAELRQAQGRRQGAAEGARGDSRSRRSREGQDRGGPFHRVPQTPPPDFTLENLLAEIAAVEEPSAGATSNTPTDPTCETNPICAESEEDVGRGRPTYEEPPAGATTNVPPDPSCETKPICEFPRAEAAEPQDQSCETKPISGTAGWDEATGARGDGQLYETKPIAEEVSSLKCEVSSEESPAATPPSLPTSNFTLETAAQPQPCDIASMPGVVPATKPISEEGVGCVSRTIPPAHSETCETKRAPGKAGAIQQVSNPARSKVAARPE